MVDTANEGLEAGNLFVQGRRTYMYLRPWYLRVDLQMEAYVRPPLVSSFLLVAPVSVAFTLKDPRPGDQQIWLSGRRGATSGIDPSCTIQDKRTL